MNIVLIGGQNIPDIGGAEAYMLNLSKALCDDNHNVTIICSGRKSKSMEVDKIKVIHKVCPKSNIVALPLLFFKSIGYIIENRQKIDVVNYQSIFMAFIPGWIARMAGCKVCYTIHSLAEDNPKHNALLKLLMRIVAFVSIWLCGNNILTISKSKAQEIRQRYGKRSSVIPCGVNLSKNNTSTDILQRHNISKEYYLTIGRIDPVKNLETLITAFKNSENDSKQLVIAGGYNNEHGKYLRKICADNSDIIFTGIVMGDDKETLLRHCYANCLVSSSEGMPISLLEAMVYSKPCIVSDIPAIREIMKDEWGYWCKVGDSKSIIEQMNKLERDYQSTLERCNAMGIYTKERHLWENISKKYTNYINGI